MYFTPNDSGFRDANDQHVTYFDLVLYGNRFKHHTEQPPPRVGLLLEALQDGDAYVFFKDTGKIENVKWMNLCRYSPSTEVGGVSTEVGGYRGRWVPR